MVENDRQRHLAVERLILEPTCFKPASTSLLEFKIGKEVRTVLMADER